MLELNELYEEMNKLATVFTPLSDQEMAIYTDHLLRYNKIDFARAVNWLIENHTYKRFPFIAEIKDAIEEVQRMRGSTKIPDEPGKLPGPTCRCESCNDTGWVLIVRPKGYDEARYCSDCEVGIRMKDSHRDYFKRRGLPWREETAEKERPLEDVPRPSGSLATGQDDGLALDSAGPSGDDDNFV